MNPLNIKKLSLFISNFKNIFIFLILGEITLALLHYSEKGTNEIKDEHVHRNSICSERRNLFIFGDSFVKGSYLDVEKRLTSQLESSNKDMNVVNFSYGGFSSENYSDTINYLKSLNLIDSNDIIVIFWNFNDALTKQSSSEDKNTRYNLLSGYKSFLYKNLTPALQKFGIILPYTNVYRLAYNTYRKYDYSSIISATSDIESTVIFVPLPRFNLLNNPSVYTNYVNSWKNLPDKFVLANSIDLFINNSNYTYSYHVSDHHPNKEAINKLFIFIQPWIEKIKFNKCDRGTD